MNIFVLGISHKTAPIEIRERFLVARTQYDEFSRLLDSDGAIRERAVLSTCNRTEIYGVTPRPGEARRRLMRGLSVFARMEESAFNDSFYFKTDPEAVGHLFGVASGLDSMALGETEILGQVKEAYRAALEKQWTGIVLNVLFQKSLAVGKQVRTQTDIGQGRISLPSIAIDLAKKIFLDLSTKKILLIGSGDVARLVCESLVAHGISCFVIANRHRERAVELVRHFGGAEIAYEDVGRCAPEIDILITSAAAPKPIIAKEKVRGWMRAKHGRALFIIDLGMPRNVESSAGELDDVYLYDIDDLKSIADQNIAGRKEAVGDCQRIVSRATGLFMERFRRLARDQKIPSLGSERSGG